MTKVKVRDMKLADTVRYTSFCEWNVAIVKQITATDVVLFRPYGTCADFSYTGGVICYVGIEEYTVPLSSEYDYELLNRKDLK